jgi:hypothetical protein
MAIIVGLDASFDKTSKKGKGIRREGREKQSTKVQMKLHHAEFSTGLLN